jgi:hypothetical protein
LKKLLGGTLLLFFVVAPVWAETIAPVSVRKLDGLVSGVAWLDAGRLVVAGQSGVRLLSLRDGASSDLIPTTPIPDGLPDPLTVTTDGRSVVASNGFERTQFACRADTKNRLFARLYPHFIVVDLAVSGNKLYVLGWPADAYGANNPDGIAVWRGGLSPMFEKFQPLHRIQSGPEGVAIFNDSLPIYGGGLAMESDGGLDVITAAEPGVFQYSPDGTFRRRLGAGLGELVVRRMHDINFTYSVDPIARYREVVNRQPTVDDLVSTPDGPAIVVRLAKNDSIEWELWYPNANRLDRRVKLGISRRGPFGHLSCDAHGDDLACVYQSPETAKAAVAIDQSKFPSYLVQFKLPSSGPTVRAMAGK